MGKASTKGNVSDSESDYETDRDLYLRFDEEDEVKPGIFRRGWRRFKLFSSESTLPFIEKYWFELILTTALLAFTIAMIVVLNLYPVMILGIAFITVGTVTPFSFLGAMTVGGAIASLVGIVLGVGALKIAILSAIKNGIEVFITWCKDKVNQVDAVKLPDASDILGESEEDSVEFDPDPDFESEPKIPQPEIPVIIAESRFASDSDDSSVSTSPVRSLSSEGGFFAPLGSPSRLQSGTNDSKLDPDGSEPVRPL